MNRHKILKATTVVILVLLVAFFIAYLNRDAFLKYSIKKVQRKLELSYKASFEIKEASFVDINSIRLNGLAVKPFGQDTLLKIRSLVAGVDLWTLLSGSIRFDKLEIKDVALFIIEKDSVNNYDFLYKKKKSSVTSLKKHKSYSLTVNNIIASFFENTPRLIEINNIQITINRNDQLFNLFMPAFYVKEKQLSAQIIDQTDSQQNAWSLKGFIDFNKEQAQFKIFSLSTKKAELPFLFNRYGLHTSFDTVYVNIDKKEYNDETLTLKGSATLINLFLNHKRLSPNDVLIANLNINYDMTVDENSIQLDSSTQVLLNKVRLQTYLRYNRTEDSLEKDIRFSVKSAPVASLDFFQSLPKGMFETLEGIQTEGDLSYHLQFHINTLMPDSLKFLSELVKNHFKILKFGTAYLPKINEAFNYTAFENGNAVRTFEVGPNNPDYTPYEEISDYLKHALLTSEDGSFFYHNGFNEEAFAKSIATNFKLGKFARGGSTISMQLVKNVFLTRNKTITRKMEEALIVWLIENNHLSTKQRMYEVYLNIIEWGPNIYGIKEASHFYFEKEPSQLNLSESIFLASIVPSPKSFKYSFDKEGNLRGYLEGYFKLVASRLLRKSIITEGEYESLETNVILRGKAKSLVVPSDSSAIYIQNGDEIVR